MCHKIESNFILVHHLKNKNFCTVYDLVQSKRTIEEKIPNVFVDVSRDSIFSSVSKHPQIFTWVDNKIHKTKNSDDYFNEPLIGYFDNDLKDEIKDKITSILEVDSQR
ncbi:MAG: hypothetical protein GX126_04220 [Bacteroidales bacterium]|jgi:hypothetical protein|nr:hypothetical protein [Bacteroidales bacterium]